MLTDRELGAILADETKLIEGDLSWANDREHRYSKKFRAPVHCSSTKLLEVVGRWSPRAEKLSYVLLYRGAGRIYALDLGAVHSNPDRSFIGSPHKHRWSNEFKDKLAYVPEDITAQWDDPVRVWQQFCSEAKIMHVGKLHQPDWQEEMIL